MTDDDDLPKDLTHITPAYRRALWIAVLLSKYNTLQNDELKFANQQSFAC